MQTAIQQIRKARKLKLKDVAASLQISEGQASRIERNGTTSLETALKFAGLLNVPVEMFIRKKDVAKAGKAA